MDNDDDAAIDRRRPPCRSKGRRRRRVVNILHHHQCLRGVKAATSQKSTHTHIFKSQHIRMHTQKPRALIMENSKEFTCREKKQILCLALSRQLSEDVLFTQIGLWKINFLCFALSATWKQAWKLLENIFEMHRKKHVRENIYKSFRRRTEEKRMTHLNKITNYSNAQCSIH